MRHARPGVPPSPVAAVSFDCYGTLVDWETGILRALSPWLRARGRPLPEAEILRMYARAEADEESGPYRSYREVLRGVVRRIAAELGFQAGEEDLGLLERSLPGWEPFPDALEVLPRLAGRFHLAVVSNVDDDLFEATARRLGRPFRTVVTAASVGAYKPDPRMFEAALHRIGVPPAALLHVAQSRYHDIAPARSLGIRTLWVRRPSPAGDAGATPEVDAAPDGVVEDLFGVEAWLRSRGG